MPRAGIARSRIHAAHVSRKVRAYRKLAPLKHRFVIAIVIGGSCYWLGHWLGIEELFRGWEFVGAAVVDKIIFSIGRSE